MNETGLSPDIHAEHRHVTGLKEFYDERYLMNYDMRYSKNYLCLKLPFSIVISKLVLVMCDTSAASSFLFCEELVYRFYEVLVKLWSKIHHKWVQCDKCFQWLYRRWKFFRRQFSLRGLSHIYELSWHYTQLIRAILQWKFQCYNENVAWRFLLQAT